MNSIFLTGASGFVGTSLINNFKDVSVRISSRGMESSFDCENNIIHLAGKAHDLEKISNPDEYYQANTELTKKSI
jgi:nucleoside-diphosphate-sugar epimerase